MLQLLGAWVGAAASDSDATAPLARWVGAVAVVSDATALLARWVAAAASDSDATAHLARGLGLQLQILMLQLIWRGGLGL